MPTIVYQKGPNGQTYAYKSTSYWSKEKKGPRTRREYLGKVDEDGNIIPKKEKQSTPVKNEDPVEKTEPVSPVLGSSQEMVNLLKEIMAMLTRMDGAMTSFFNALQVAGNDQSGKSLTQTQETTCQTERDECQ